MAETDSTAPDMEYQDIQRLARTIAPTRDMLDAVIKIAQNWKPLHNQISLLNSKKEALEKALESGAKDLRTLNQRVADEKTATEQAVGRMLARQEQIRLETQALVDEATSTTRRLINEVDAEQRLHDDKIKKIKVDHADSIGSMQKEHDDTRERLQADIDAKTAELQRVTDEHAQFVERIAGARR